MLAVMLALMLALILAAMLALMLVLMLVLILAEMSVEMPAGTVVAPVGVRGSDAAVRGADVEQGATALVHLPGVESEEASDVVRRQETYVVEASSCGRLGLHVEIVDYFREPMALAR